MRKIKLTFFALLIFCFSESTEAVEPKGIQYQINGDIKNLKGWVYLEMSSGNLDSTLSKNGKFMFEGSITQIEFARIYSDKTWLVPLIPDSREIVVTGDVVRAKEIKVTGSPQTARESLAYKFYEIPGTADPRRDSLFSVFKKELSRIVSENSGNKVGVMAVVDNAIYLSPDEKLHNISLLTPGVQENTQIKSIKTFAEHQLLSSEGLSFVEVALPDTSGRQVSLGELTGRGKYVLIDFWASWCKPCVEVIPALKKVYDKYHSKGFEILGISLDKKRSMWVGAINKYEANWLHVSSLDEWKCPAVRSYGIELVPATILIGPDGTIITRNVTTIELEQILRDNLN